MEIGSVSRPAAGESVCGDALLVRVLGEGGLEQGALVAVVDGLGHGPLAAEASRAVTAYLQQRPWTDLAALLKDCSVAVAATRGAAVSLLHVDLAEMRLRHCGIGNVETVVCGHAPVRPVSLPGVVGSRLRKVLETSHPLAHGDVLAVFSDGISSRLDLAAYRRFGAQRAADSILAEWGKGHDDATCVVLVV